MKSKTIKRILQSKLDAWCKSIAETDPNLAKAVQKDAIFTGGCIASMLLNEPVNDYDVYLATESTALAVARHYAKSFKDVDVISGRETQNITINARADYHQRALMGLDPDRVKLAFVGGGGYKCNAVDSNEDKGRYLPAYFSANAITLTDQIQVVIRFHGDADKIHTNYDFVHATNYYHKESLVLRPAAVLALLQKELRYIGSKYPLTSMIRTKKFVLRGYKISAGQYLKIAFQISRLDLTCPFVLEEQLAGVDVAYFATLIEAIRSRSSDEPIEYHYMAELIDRIFEGESSKTA